MINKDSTVRVSTEWKIYMYTAYYTPPMLSASIAPEVADGHYYFVKQMTMQLYISTSYVYVTNNADIVLIGYFEDLDAAYWTQ